MKVDFKWIIQYPGQSFTEFSPDYEDISFEDAIYKDKFFRRNIKVDLKLRKDDFDDIWALEISNDPCLSLPIKLQLFDANTAQYVDKLEGFISLKKGDYDANRCTASFSPETSDIYDCLIETEKSTIDLFQIANRYAVDTVIGQIETINEQYGFDASLFDGFNTILPPKHSVTAGWTLTFRDILDIHTGGTGLPTTHTYGAIDVYQRQYINQVAQPAAGWVNVGGDKWVSTLPIRIGSQVKTTQSGGAGSSGSFGFTVRYATSYSIVDFEADNALKLIDVLPLLIDCGKTIISNFFDLNADATSPSNIAYTYAADHLQNLHLFQASDIINADASGNATKFEVKKGEFLDDILQFFNLEVYFDETADAFRLEHVSYRQALRGADFLTERWEDIKRSYNYKYDSDEIPTSKAFKFKFDSESEIFDTNLIEFEPKCSNGNDEPLRLKNIVTNIANLYNNDKYAEDNFRLSAVLLEIEDGVIPSDQGVLNYSLSFRAIIQALHVYNQPLSEGLINGVLVTFESKKPIKLQPIEVSMSIGQYLDNYSPYKEYKTQLGWGAVKSSQYDPNTKKLKINLLQ